MDIFDLDLLLQDKYTTPELRRLLNINPVGPAYMRKVSYVSKIGIVLHATGFLMISRPKEVVLFGSDYRLSISNSAIFGELPRWRIVMDFEGAEQLITPHTMLYPALLKLSKEELEIQIAIGACKIPQNIFPRDPNYKWEYYRLDPQKKRKCI